MTFHSILSKAKISLADFPHSIVANVDGEFFSISYFELLATLNNKPKKFSRNKLLEKVTYLIAWHLVAQLAYEEQFVLSHIEEYRLCREKNLLLHRFHQLITSKESNVLSKVKIQKNIDLLVLKDCEAITKLQESNSCVAIVGTYEISMNEILKHMPPQEYRLLSENSVTTIKRLTFLLNRYFKEACTEKEALILARSEKTALIEVLHRLEEHAIFVAYMSKKRFGKYGANIPLTSEELNEVSDNELRSHYDSSREFNKVVRVKALRIVVKDYKLAKKLIAKAQSGVSFESLAQKYSISPEGVNGGSLGILEREKQGRINQWTKYLIFQHLQKNPDSRFLGPLRIGIDGDYQIFSLWGLEFEKIHFEEVKNSLKEKLVREKLQQRGIEVLSKLLENKKIILNKRYFQQESNTLL